MPSDTSGVGRELVPARLQVRLLGAVEIILDGRRLRAFNSLRLQRFLALIALRRDPQHRSRLAFELWPDSDERQARTNLRKLLHDFRHSLPDIGEFVEIDNETVRWIPTGPTEVDVLRFRDAMAAGDFELAARLYSGDLLPACYDDWVLDERAKLRAEAYGALVRLTEEAAGRDDHKATIRHAQRIIDLEPTDEAAVRIQMEAHLALGDRAAALRCYHRYAEVLERDLAVAPGEAIGAMYQQLRAGAPNRDEVQGKDLPVAESPFVGRDLEWNQLIEAWNTAREGGAHLFLVTGEPGIGKSRLALELGTSRSSRRTRGGIGSCVRGCGQTAVGSRRRPAPIGCYPKPHRHARHGLEGRARSSPARTPRRFPANWTETVGRRGSAPSVVRCCKPSHRGWRPPAFADHRRSAVV